MRTVSPAALGEPALWEVPWWLPAPVQVCQWREPTHGWPSGWFDDGNGAPRGVSSPGRQWTLLGLGQMSDILRFGEGLVASLWLDAESLTSPGASLGPPSQSVRTTLPDPSSQGRG